MKLLSRGLVLCLLISAPALGGEEGKCPPSGLSERLQTIRASDGPLPSEISFLSEKVRAQLRVRNWPKFQIDHFIKNAPLADLIGFAGQRDLSSLTTAYFGTRQAYDPALAGTLDEFTNPAVALRVFARSFGRSEGYVNLLTEVPRRALQGRMGQPDTLAYEQAQLFVPNYAGHPATHFVRYSIPSREFAEIFEACCAQWVLRANDPRTPGVPVEYINPAHEETVNRLILEAVRQRGRYEIPNRSAR